MKVIISLSFLNNTFIIFLFTDRRNRYRVRKHLILTGYIGKDDLMKLKAIASKIIIAICRDLRF